MSTILILDTETTGVDVGAVAIEVACALYSVEHASVIRSFSSLIRHHENPAEAVNHISAALLAEAPENGSVWNAVARMGAGVRAVVAHNAEFDQRHQRAFIPGCVPWVCSMDDLAWPRATKPAGESLISLTLAHGLGVASAHRAAADVDMLARLFTRAAELGADIDTMLTRGLRPKALFVARVSFARKDEAKAHGFRWNDPIVKEWSRRMAIEDAAALPFDVVRVES